jgi:hypothetical protein
MGITSYFFHNTLRKYIIAFGTLFNEMTVQRDNNVVIPVPLAYGSKQKWLARIQTNPTFDKPQSVTLPRMSFIITNIMYDTQRKVSSIGKMVRPDLTDNTQAYRLYNPVPYRIDISLTIYSKNMSDFLQIMEQIIPFFKPQFVVTIRDITNVNVKLDVPIELNDISIIHDSEGPINEYRVINSDLNFTVLGNFFGPVQPQKLITNVVIDTRLGNANFGNPDAIPDERYHVKPDPNTAYATDDYGFEEWYEDFPEGPKVP